MTPHARFALPALFLLLACGACGEEPAGPEPHQNPPEEPSPATDTALATASATITAGDMAVRVGVLADDSMEGRYTESAGLEAAAAYIVETLTGLGLEPRGTEGYLQRYDFSYTLMDTTEAVLEPAEGGAANLANGRDYVVLGSVAGDGVGPVLWGGSAVTSPDAGGHGMRNAVVMYDLPVTRFDGPALQMTMDIDRETQAGDAVAVGLVVPDDFSEAQMARALRFSLRSARAIPMFWIRESAAEALMSAVGVDLPAVRAGGPQALDARLHVHGAIHTEPARPPNVVAALRGSDPMLRDRWVVVSAHFDHVGVDLPDEHGDSIFNGADDNASGTAAVLEVAEAMASLSTAPARSVLFLLVSGEEEGLVGSNAFAASPTVSLGSIVADINMDMIGRNDPGMIIGAGAAYSSLGAMAVRLGTKLQGLGLRVVPDTASERNLFGRSDQRSFACRNVPSLLLTSGLHEDYHRASDELSRLDTDKAARVARLVFHLAYLTANDLDPTTWTEAGLAAVSELRCF